MFVLQQPLLSCLTLKYFIFPPELTEHQEALQEAYIWKTQSSWFEIKSLHHDT